MRDLSHPEINRYRLKTPQILQRYGSFGDNKSGVFLITAKTDGKKVKLRVIASSGMGWDHLSISLPNRTPVWSEMEKVKRIFFKEDEWGIQYHARKTITSISINIACIYGAPIMTCCLSHQNLWCETEKPG